MKIIIAFFFILISKIGSTQPYQSIFGKDSTTWLVAWVNQDIENETRFSTSSSIVYNSNTYNLVSTNVYVLLREDTLTGKVWSVDLSQGCVYVDSTERLVVDMSLQLGDSFNISASDIEVANPADTIVIVDSVYYVQGQKRIRFASPASVYPGWLTEPITFIEGIGTNYSLFWMMTYCSAPYLDKYLLCVFKDGIKADYTNLRYNGDCYPDFEMGVKNVALDKISITPNPATNNLLISANDFQPQTISIYNLNGQQLINLPFAREVDISILAPGVYFVEVTGAQGTEVRKLVKED